MPNGDRKAFGSNISAMLDLFPWVREHKLLNEEADRLLEESKQERRSMVGKIRKTIVKVDPKDASSFCGPRIWP